MKEPPNPSIERTATGLAREAPQVIVPLRGPIRQPPLMSNVRQHNRPPRPPRVGHLCRPLVAMYIRHAYNGHMSSIQFEWDPKKSQVNLRKHKVSFEDAQSVFSDERALLIDDPDHSEEEDRFVLLGLSQSLRLLVVVHCYRAEGRVIRIISARKADADEQSIYR
jgi:uncharacterized protein